MYKRSKDVDYIDASELPTRQFDKIVLKQRTTRIPAPGIEGIAAA